MTPWISFLLLALCSAEPPDFWPSDELAMRTPELISAGRRAAAQIACEVCAARLTGLLQHRDLDELQDSLEGDGYDAFEEQLSNAKVLCNMKDLASVFRHLKLKVQVLPNAPAILRVTEDGSVPFYEDDVSAESQFHWKSFVIEQACVDNFRRGADSIASSFKDIFLSGKSIEGKEDRSAEASRQACEQSKACRRQRRHEALREKHRRHEEVLAAKTLRRQQDRLNNDKTFQPSDSDFDAPKAFEYDVRVNYYKVTGAEELSPHAEIERRCNKFDIMFELHQTMSKIGMKQPQDDADMREREAQVSAACAVLLDQPTRRQYDNERDSLDAASEAGLKKRLPDKDSMDGRKILQQFDPAEREL